MTWTLEESLVAAEEVAQAFDALGVRYAVGGSVASSLHGVPRATMETFRVVSAEDIVVEKLRWWKLGGGVSDRQWRDAVGVVRVQAQLFDEGYARRRAAAIGVAELLERSW